MEDRDHVCDATVHVWRIEVLCVMFFFSSFYLYMNSRDTTKLISLAHGKLMLGLLNDII